MRICRPLRTRLTQIHRVAQLLSLKTTLRVVFEITYVQDLVKGDPLAEL